MKKVILVDDHNLILNSLKKLIDGIDGFVVTHSFNSGLAFLETLPKMDHSQIDLVLLDIKMPNMNGIEVLKKVNNLGLSLKVLPLSMEYDENIILKMIKLGAKGYLLKDANVDQFKIALNNVISKGFHHSEIVNDVLLKEVTNLNSSKPILSKKEAIFLQHACSDLTYKEIAKLMFVSPKTVDGYRESLFKKFHVKSRVGLALEAVKTGFVSL